jgi:hypothetical protein
MLEITHGISILLTSIQHSYVSCFLFHGTFPSELLACRRLNSHYDFILDGKPQRFNSDDTGINDSSE